MDGQGNGGYNSALIAALRSTSDMPQQMGGISFFDPSAGFQNGMQGTPINFTPSSRQAAFNPEAFMARAPILTMNKAGSVAGSLGRSLLDIAMNKRDENGGFVGILRNRLRNFVD